MKNNAPIAEIMAIVNACESVIIATCDDTYPDVRHMANAMNRDAVEPPLYLMTGRNTPKYAQLASNPACTLYYFDDKTRHAVRLYGKIEFISDMRLRMKYWRPEYSQFGYNGPESSDFILMRFIPDSYKYYIGPDMKSGQI